MTSRERLLCAFSCGRPDRVPVAPFGFGSIDPESQLGHELWQQTDFIQSVSGAGSSFWGRHLRTTTEVLGNRTRIIYHTPRGDLERVVQSTEVTAATIQFPCHSADDLEQVLSVPFEPASPNPQLFQQWKDRLGDDGVVLCELGDALCAPAELFSPEDFALLWADAPDAFVHLVEVANERACIAAELACQAGIDAFRIIGGEYASTQLGPSAYRQVVTEPDRQLVQIMHDHGALVYYHNHGPVMQYLEMFAEIGMDAADCFEAPPWGDCDLAAAQQVLQGRVCMVGNLDDMEVIDKLDSATVCHIASQRLAQVAPEGFVLGGTASGTYGERGARNFVALADWVRAAAAG